MFCFYFDYRNATNTNSGQNEQLILHGKLSAVAFGDDADDFQFETIITGRFLAVVPLVRKLRHFLLSGDKCRRICHNH